MLLGLSSRWMRLHLACALTSEYRHLRISALCSKQLNDKLKKEVTLG